MWKIKNICEADRTSSVLAHCEQCAVTLLRESCEGASHDCAWGCEERQPGAKLKVLVELENDNGETKIIELMLEQFFKSGVEQDEAAVVLCDLNHTIVYMNPAAAKRYEASGGYELVGKSLMGCHPPKSREMIEKVVAWFRKSESHNRIYTFYNEKENKDVYMIALRDDDKKLIGYYEKHAYRNRETDKLYDFGE